MNNVSKRGLDGGAKFKYLLRPLPHDKLGMLDNFSTKITYEMQDHIMSIQEERITMLLNPKPKWLPQFLYKKILRKLIRKEVYRV